jgi:hypothetical protein
MFTVSERGTMIVAISPKLLALTTWAKLSVVRATRAISQGWRKN